ncbi:histidine kinase [Tenacibaculum sp. IB213877]|uniref:sensor histidine kinase n=1 Tax=Tenacibaculum sp. IB213877 TaxID=3097351 RepID=UPI002A5AF6CA|nr:histidine kinase [Tenacibaculum sp. IB213877]MDY0781138.1 histidine kinase [Tenacibaculum sp. IB213877]
MKKALHIFVLLFLTSKYFFGQDVYYKQFTSDEGLTALSNYNIVKDKNNLMWIGSNEGLFYYDGKSFNKINNTKISTKSIFNLQKDTDGQLWCSTLSGHIYKVINKQLILFKDLSNELKGAYANLIIKRNHVYFLSQKQCFQIDKQTRKATKIVNHKISKSIETQKGFYYQDYGGGNILTSVEEKGDTIVFSEVNKNNSKNLDNGYFQMLPYKNNFMLVLNSSKIAYKLNENKKELEEITLPVEIKRLNLHLYNLKKIDNLYWLLTSKGVIVLKEQEEDFFVLEKHYLKHYHFTDLVKDDDQNYWLTTLHNGVVVIPNLGISKEKIIEDYDIISITPVNENTLFLGTQNGKLIEYNTQNRRIKNRTLPTNRAVNRLHFDKHSQKLYISTNGREGYVFSLKNNKINTHSNQLATAKGFNQIGKDSLLYLSYRNSRIYTNINKDLTSFVELEDKRPISSHYDSKNKQIYISYIDGTLNYNSSLDTTSVFLNKKNIIFNAFVQTSTNQIWAQANNKLYQIKKAKIVDSLTTAKGLLSSQIKGIQSNNEFLWIITEKGIQKYNTLSKEIETIKLKDKNSIKFKQPVFHKNALWIPGNNFLCKLDLNNKELIKQSLIPKAYIANVSIGDEFKDKKEKYELPYKVNNITFKLRANGFLASKQNVFQYKLIGYDTNWHTAEVNDDIVRYIGIPSGSYEFLLRTKSLDGKIGNVTEKIRIYVQKPFWDNWWFYALIFALLTGAIVIYYRIKIKNKEEEGQRELEKVILDSRISKLKLENLRSQMNPHFIFNSLGAIQDYVMKNEKYLASDYLVKFSRLIRLYLDHSRLNTILLKEELHSLEIYIALEQLRFENKFEVHLSVDNRVDKEHVIVPPLFIQPFVENAIKHGLVHKKESGNLWIYINKLDENSIQVIVEDDGIGRKKSSEINKKRRGHQSFAVSATQERVALYKKEKLFDVEVTFEDKYSKDQQALGTKVIITIKKI